MSEQQRKVLVVDDEALIADLLQTTLEEAGFSVASAMSDAEAMHVLERDRGRDLVGLITDVRLGGARSGWDIAHKARQLNPGLPVIYITGDSGHEWSANGVPNSTVITKPFAYSQVIVALSSLINQSDNDG